MNRPLEYVAEAAPDDVSYAHQEIDHGIAPRRIGETVLEVRNITLRFGGVVALKNISFDVQEGEVRASLR
jgi:ABC-type uncharacterized transport systems, ATPase components